MVPIFIITLLALGSQVSAANLNVDQKVALGSADCEGNINVNQEVEYGDGGTQNDDNVAGGDDSNDGNVGAEDNDGDDGDDGDAPTISSCTLADFEAGDIDQCATESTDSECLTGVSGTSEVAEGMTCPSNPFVDALLKKVAEFVQPLIREKGFDPMALPSESYSFTIKLGGFTLEVELAVYDGWVTGLSNFTLCGDFVNDSGVINGIEATATFPELEGNYTGKVTVMNYGPTANITLKVEGTSADVILIYNTTSCKFEATDVTLNVGKIDFEICGLGPLDPILEEVLDFLTNLVVPYLQKWASNELKILINKALANINLDSIKKEITDTGNLLLDCQASQEYPTTHEIQWPTTIPN